MKDCTEQTIDKWLDALADRQPAPGGGAGAACAGALAAALGRMVVAYSVGANTPEPDRARFDSLATQLQVMDQLLRALMTRDAQAYLAMTDAARVAKKDPSARSAYQEAVLAAIGVPMEIAAVATSLLAALDAAKDGMSRYMVSDLGVTAVVACAAVDGAGYMVRVNLAEVDDRRTQNKIAGDIRAVARRSAAHRASIESFVSGRLEPGS